LNFKAIRGNARIGGILPLIPMSNFVKLAAQAELPLPGEAREFLCEGKGKDICVANINGVLSAMDNVCLHQGGPLGQGVIEDGKIVCPWHGWQWDPKTGEASHDPKAKVTVYPIKQENGDLYIDIEAPASVLSRK
jgi:nitrite reductase/ring-hydroxylating ferredoxin subunit